MKALVIPVKRMPTRLPYFDYKIPNELLDKIKVGQMVFIPLRSQSIFGVVKKILPEKSSDKLKFIESIVFEEPLISSEQLNFLEEISELYHTPLTFLIKNNLPPLQKRKLKKVIVKKNTPIKNKTKHKPRLIINQDLLVEINYIEKKINIKKQNLILAPEISQVKILFNNLSDEIKEKTIIITSELSEKELFEKWWQIKNKEKTIILGTRAGLFLPWDNLSNIFLTDEGNENYKSWDMSPRFHTRDASLALSHHFGAKLHLLSPTPSIESYYFAQKKVYEKQGKLMPFTTKTKVLDLNKEKKSSNYSIFSDLAREQIKKTAQPIFIFLNKKGTANYIVCKDCGEVLSCPHCKNFLTYYHVSQKIKCHHCNYEDKMRSNCRNCGGSNLNLKGLGTEFIAEELKKSLPNKKIIQIDSDTKTKTIKSEDNQIIIGTQYAWGEINWDKLGLVIFLDADTSLYVPEYKVTQELWQKIRKAQYLTKNGSVIIQTSQVQNFTFQSIIKPEKFYDLELEMRKSLEYPPFKFILKIFYGDKDQKQSFLQADKKYNELLALTKDQKNVRIFNPLPAFPAFKQGKYWQIIIIKIGFENYKKTTKLINQTLSDDWKSDPNPINLLSV